jgi:hypothetical protein
MNHNNILDLDLVLSPVTLEHMNDSIFDFLQASADYDSHVTNCNDISSSSESTDGGYVEFLTESDIATIVGDGSGDNSEDIFESLLWHVTSEDKNQQQEDFITEENISSLKRKRQEEEQQDNEDIIQEYSPANKKFKSDNN